MGKIHDVSRDREMAKSLKKMAEKTNSRIKETDKNRYTSQVVKDYYNVIHHLMEAISVSLGKKVKGRGAHAQLISFICEEFELGSGLEQFLQELRKYRNRISYEGFFIEKDYLDRNEEKIEGVIEKLNSILKEALK